CSQQEASRDSRSDGSSTFPAGSPLRKSRSPLSFAFALLVGFLVIIRSPFVVCARAWRASSSLAAPRRTALAELHSDGRILPPVYGRHPCSMLRCPSTATPTCGSQPFFWTPCLRDHSSGGEGNPSATWLALGRRRDSGPIGRGRAVPNTQADSGGPAPRGRDSPYRELIGSQCDGDGVARVGWEYPSRPAFVWHVYFGPREGEGSQASLKQRSR